MKMKTNVSGIIRTINDDDEVEDFSEDSDEDMEFQPSKQKDKKKADFDAGFQFVSSASEYNKDVWDDLTKYVKRKATSKTDDKIRARKNKLKETANDSDVEIKSEEEDGDDEVHISDDELQHDSIKEKQSAAKGRKRRKQAEAEASAEAEATEQRDFFEDAAPPDENATFYQMNLSRPLLKAVGELRYAQPTPIQAATIPVALLGRDVCGCAATGTGKTAAYVLPTLERLLWRPARGPAATRALVLVPTRELGVQVYQVARQLAQYTGVQVGLAVGGLDLRAQEAVLRARPDMVVATPGRLIDHLASTPSFGLDAVEVLVLDEADRMLDEHFAEQLREIVRRCARTRQTMLFSATMTERVRDLAAVSLTRPVRVFVDSNRDVALNLRQEFVRVRPGREADREPLLAALVCRTFRSHCIVFVQTKRQAHRLHVVLGLLGVRAGELHGDLTQPQRLDALARFRDGQLDVLVATDVAARGLDIHGVRTVLNFVMPATLEHYIHRVGRTARAGRAGVSVSLAGESERRAVREVLRKARHPVKCRAVPPAVLDKYRARLQALEPDVEHVLAEERAERLLSKAENQANRAQRQLEGGAAATARPWFQTSRERKAEKERLALVPTAGASAAAKKKGGRKGDGEGDAIPGGKGKNDKKKAGKRGRDTAEQRALSEIDKVALLQARLAKRKRRPQRIRSCPDASTARAGPAPAKRKSNFSDELLDVSGRGVKRARHQANAARSAKNRPNNKGFKAGTKGGAKKGTGKAFGRPQSKKSKR